MITTIGTIEFLAVLVLSEMETNALYEKKTLKWTYPELRQHADRLEEEFPSIRIDLRRTSIENIQYIHSITIDTTSSDLQVIANNNSETRQIMEIYRPAGHIYQRFKKIIVQ